MALEHHSTSLEHHWHQLDVAIHASNQNVTMMAVSMHSFSHLQSIGKQRAYVTLRKCGNKICCRANLVYVVFMVVHRAYS